MCDFLNCHVASLQCVVAWHVRYLNLLLRHITLGSVLNGPKYFLGHAHSHTEILRNTLRAAKEMSFSVGVTHSEGGMVG